MLSLSHIHTHTRSHNLAVKYRVCLAFCVCGRLYLGVLLADHASLHLLHGVIWELHHLLTSCTILHFLYICVSLLPGSHLCSLVPCNVICLFSLNSTL